MRHTVSGTCAQGHTHTRAHTHTLTHSLTHTLYTRSLSHSSLHLPHTHPHSSTLIHSLTIHSRIHTHSLTPHTLLTHTHSICACVHTRTHSSHTLRDIQTHACTLTPTYTHTRVCVGLILTLVAASSTVLTLTPMWVGKRCHSHRCCPISSRYGLACVQAERSLIGIAIYHLASSTLCFSARGGVCFQRPQCNLLRVPFHRCFKWMPDSSCSGKKTQSHLQSRWLAELCCGLCGVQPSAHGCLSPSPNACTHACVALRMHSYVRA